MVTLTVPPLRQRREDIPELAQSFLERSSRQLGKRVTGFEPSALEALMRHDWPGNVGELINVVERGVLLARSDTVRLEDLRAEPGSAPERGPSRRDDEPLPLEEARRQVVERFERDYLERALTQARGRIAETAQIAGVSERTLYSMMKRYGLRKEDFKTAVQKRYNPGHSS